MAETNSTDIEPQTDGEIGISQYAGRRDLVRAVVPEGVRRVDDFAFAGCDGLTSIALPDSLTEIGCGAFAGCSGLTEIALPAGVREIGHGAFAHCVGLRSIALPEAFGDLRADMFEGCESLREVKAGQLFAPSDGFVVRVEDGVAVLALPAALRNGELRLPDGAKGVAKGALVLCGRAERLVIPKTVESIDRGAFEGLDGLKCIETEEGGALLYEEGNLWNGDTLVLHMGKEDVVRVRARGARLRIGERAFAKCGMKEVRMEFEGELEIGDMAFEGCARLERVEFPGRGRVSMGVDAFAECSTLAGISIPSDMRAIPEGAFANCVSLRDVDLHDDIEEIGDQAFVGCGKIQSVELPMGLRRIGCGAFAWSGLTAVAIPRGVEEVGDFAFGMCRALEAATMPKSCLARAGEIFVDCPRLEIMGANDKTK